MTTPDERERERHHHSRPPEGVTRRAFVGLTAVGLAGLAAPRADGASRFAPEPGQTITSDIRTNIADALKFPRVATSMPGKYPGVVVKVHAGSTATNGRIDGRLARRALEQGLTKLTGKSSAREAWLQFVSPADRVGIKVNPVVQTLYTSHELTQAVIDGLLDAGVPKSQIAVWDRRLFQLRDAGFTPERFGGVEVLGTEIEGPNGKFYNDKGELWSLDNIDRDAPSYFADIEGVHTQSGLPYMINGGKHSYFTKLVTRRFTKIINVPIFKTVQPVGVSFCLKNLTYGALSNTSRLHQVGVNAIPEACAFPCLRDKAVLHIGDALRASYYGGVGAPPQYTFDANLLFIGSDAVSVDLLAQEFATATRISRGVQSDPNPRDRLYLDIAAKLGLGVADRARIDVRECTIV
jgi:hypothetical protein